MEWEPRVGSWPALVLWRPPQWDWGYVTPVIHAPTRPAHTHTHTHTHTYTHVHALLDPTAPCNNPLVINRVLIMAAEHRLCLMSTLVVISVQLDWLLVVRFATVGVNAMAPQFGKYNVHMPFVHVVQLGLLTNESKLRQWAKYFPFYTDPIILLQPRPFFTQLCFFTLNKTTLTYWCMIFRYNAGAPSADCPAVLSKQ